MLSHEVADALIQERIRICEEACAELIAVSERCADECLALKGDGEITACFVADLNCVEIALVTVRVLSWTTSGNHAAAIAILEACAEACAESAAACERMAQLHSAWETCTDACHRVSNACTELQVALSAY
jgi:hypothetical protein